MIANTIPQVLEEGKTLSLTLNSDEGKTLSLLLSTLKYKLKGEIKMIKTSFTVCYRLNQQTHLVLGVTSIVPNLNGYLMFTEDRKNHFIESHELIQGSLAMGYLSYEYTDELNPEAIVHDHRKEVAE